jgi:hypothetical protein
VLGLGAGGCQAGAQGKTGGSGASQKGSALHDLLLVFLLVDGRIEAGDCLTRVC